MASRKNISYKKILKKIRVSRNNSQPQADVLREDSPPYVVSSVATERNGNGSHHYLVPNDVYLGDNRAIMRKIKPASVALSFWSPPYFVGKEYEKDVTFQDWQEMLREVIECHAQVLIPGGFMAINIANILCFADPTMPKIQAPNIRLHRSPISREQVLEAKHKFPNYSRYELATYLGCSEQTVDRRLNGNNIRGGKYNDQTRVKVVGGFLEEFCLASGLYLYDHRIWMKDPTWANSQWHSSSYRAVSEFEDLYVFWKPGETVVDRHRLTDSEWSEWGSRGVWQIRSVQKNDDHPAKFPMMLAKRIIKLLSEKDSVVLDPFLGSGTTAIAAIQMGRQFIGIEKEKRYLDIAKKNIEDASSVLIKTDFRPVELFQHAKVQSSLKFQS
jgi:site-specific DNA-methyltransferase (adenine-specific)